MGLQLRNQGWGRAWGSIGLEPALPGLTATPTFDESTRQGELDLDTAPASPGVYEGNLVIHAEAVPDATRIPVRYEVVPFQARVEPPGLHLRTLPHGSPTSAAEQIHTSPPGGAPGGAGHGAAPRRRTSERGCPAAP